MQGTPQCVQGAPDDSLGGVCKAGVCVCVCVCPSVSVIVCLCKCVRVFLPLCELGCDQHLTKAWVLAGSWQEGATGNVEAGRGGGGERHRARGEHLILNLSSLNPPLTTCFYHFKTFFAHVTFKLD